MVTKPYILVVDDKEWERKFLKEFLEESGYKVDEAGDGEEAIEKIKNNTYDLVITDLRMGEQSGFDVLKTAKTQSYKPEVIVITAYGTIESAVNAIKLDAFDYLTKPLDSKRVLITIGQALERKLLRNEVQSLRNQLEEKYSRKRIVAESDEMRKILEVIDLVTRTDSTVLIEGESGTGKELVARALHFSGPRARKPFITVNCAALPEPLLESELFGHVKGTFTGAVKDKKGLFEEADEGTLLLDEIAEMPMSIQVKLLRVLQEGSIRKVGGAAEIDVD
ncbi:MAG TPA: sigma-54-dependent Fis family transcriptional regulator, partial [Spirochaetes bacterium]|nr:sigma-54-dependent Fis family transcriptional regulator [Spirochaetota bacterium]